MEEKLEELKRRLGEIVDLRTCVELLFWDQTVMMPPGGAAVRAEQLTTLDRIAHERFVDDEIGALLEELRPYEESLPTTRTTRASSASPAATGRRRRRCRPSSPPR